MHLEYRLEAAATLVAVSRWLMYRNPMASFVYMNNDKSRHLSCWFTCCVGSLHSLHAKLTVYTDLTLYTANLTVYRYMLIWQFLL